MKKVKLITFLKKISNAYNVGKIKGWLPYTANNLPTSVEFKDIEFFMTKTLSGIDYLMKDEYGNSDCSIFSMIDAKDINRAIILHYK